MTEVVVDVESLSKVLAEIRQRGGRVGLVPTMGALHRGHRALVEASAAACAATVVSVFVNPLQFDDPDDLAAYPRTVDGDVALASGAGATACFVPSVEVMYPSGRPLVRVDPGPLGSVLEGASRPGHLAGVATVVAKLLASTRPDVAFFGEKDYQQLVLVRRLVADLSFPVEVAGVGTVREEDGLALSSRNRRLSGAARAAAATLYRALLAGREAVVAGASPSQAAAAMRGALEANELVEVDYAVVRDAEDLAEVPDDRPPVALRLLVAARVGGVRLIDNVGVDVPGVTRA